MSINNLPDDILNEIFNYAGCWDVLALVCRQWKEVIEVFHHFARSTFYEKPRIKAEYAIAENSCRKFKLFVLSFEDKEMPGLESFLKLLANPGTVENVEIRLSNNHPDFAKFTQLMNALQDVKSIKIVAHFDNRKKVNLKKFQRSPIQYQHLKNLEIYYQSLHMEFIDAFLEVMDVPVLEKFALKCRDILLKELNTGLEFAVKWSKKKLRNFDIACFVSDLGYWHEFLWNESMLKIAECNNPTILNYFSAFVQDHAEADFPKLKQVFFYRNSLPNHIGSLMFRNCVNIETFSGDIGIPPFDCQQVVYKNLKILKYWWWNPRREAEAVHSLNRACPNLETFLICEWIPDSLKQLARINMLNLKDFRTSIDSYTYHTAYPPNEKMFRF